MTSGDGNLIRGALVQWTMGNSYGVIVAVDERLITVRWDEEGIPTQFAAGNPPLSRVDLIGTPVCRRSTGEDVAVLNPVGGSNAGLAMPHLPSIGQSDDVQCG